jgi:Ca2+-dependent lipid-binding protein
MDFIPVDMEIEPRERLSNMGQLRVEVLGATDLPPRYPIDYSDPYCRFELNEQEVFTTKRRAATQHPAWNESFKVAIRSRIAARLAAHVYYWATGENDNYLGSAIIDLERLEPFKAQGYTLPLNGEGGPIRLQLQFRPEYITRTHLRQ